MVCVSRRLSSEEFLALPDDGSRHELVRGELRALPPSRGRHGVSTKRSLSPHWTVTSLAKRRASAGRSRTASPHVTPWLGWPPSETWSYSLPCLTIRV